MENEIDDVRRVIEEIESTINEMCRIMHKILDRQKFFLYDVSTSEEDKMGARKDINSMKYQLQKLRGES